METEEEIVYSIIETVKKGTLSDDSRLDERIIRNFLRIYRASSIAKNSMNGLIISDECFQYLGELEFSYLKPKQFTRDMPKTIRLADNFGLMFEKNGENIPIVNSEAFNLGLKNIINGKLPKAKLLGDKATIYIGTKIMTCCGIVPSDNLIINDFIDELLDTAGLKIKIDVHAILDNPDHAPGYDWTNDPYPCPSELIEEIKSKILQKEFNLILQIRADKVTDGEDEDQREQRQQAQ
jgi:hypothetical protein